MRRHHPTNGYAPRRLTRLDNFRPIEIVSSYNTAFGAYACTDLWCVVALRAVDEI
ncbi:hypothetical protein SAMN02745244_01415 [Tessaracoccus bendigoensis DSM 12906]|uniref:Uncharacterized protein n=1 Tax=Tessaracoccus bendigoensis DSM 12906 TaxID=1123357 RepID=A0A1M6FDU7_9ACTN|nr:hypothetical protein [Tessaracoccus bendigoensis]SHI95832.1 hypothetical protein SAMN02745244_01415 [Tessaracoccus bendigoensis DSM 12906]